MVIDGAGLFDIRSGFLDASSSKCNGDLEICCQLPKYRKSGKKKPFESTTSTIAITMTTGYATTLTTTTQFEGIGITTTTSTSTSTETTTATTSMTSSTTSAQFEGITITTTETTTHQPVPTEGSTEKGKPLGSSKSEYNLLLIIVDFVKAASQKWFLMVLVEG